MGKNSIIFFRLITFPKRSLLLQKKLRNISEIWQIVDIHFFENVPFEKKTPYQTQSISTCYLICLALALISKPTHENIGFEKLQFIDP